MTTSEKAEAIIKKITEICNKGENVEFEEDFGGNTLTIYIKSPDGSNCRHTHMGVPNGSFDILVDNLYNTLHGGPGLSWA